MADSHYKSCKTDVETSLAEARELRDQLFAILRGSPRSLPRTQFDNIKKTFKNTLFTTKWTCQDLEELVRNCENDTSSNLSQEEISEAKQFVTSSWDEINMMLGQLDDAEASERMYNKHGISYHDSPVHNRATSNYKLPQNDTGEEVQFDRAQLESGGSSVLNNALYDHLEQLDESVQKTLSPSQVFNNLSRPIANVYVNPNEDEMILDMLETEYYNPPVGLQTRPRFQHSVRKLYDTDRNRFLAAVAFLFSFPVIVFLLFIV